jgi:hypothetical protein
VTSEASPLPDQRARLRQETGHFPAYQLVSSRFLAVRVDFASVGNVPSAHSGAVVVSLGLARRSKLGLFGVKGVAILVLCATNGLLGWDCIDHEDSVLGPIDVRVYSQTEQMLVVVSVDTCTFVRILEPSWVSFSLTWIHLRAPAFGVFSFVDRVRVENSSELDFGLDRTILLQSY